MTLTTFNGLAGGAAMTRLGFATPQDITDFRPATTAHYVVTNDLVNRLGGEHLAGGNVYKLDFKSDKINPSTGQAYLLGPVDAHRIETGFYRSFARQIAQGDNRLFTQATAYADWSALPVEGLQAEPGHIISLFNKGAITEESGRYRAVAALVYALNQATREHDIDALFKPVLEMVEQSDLAASQTGHLLLPLARSLTAEDVQDAAGELRAYAMRNLLSALVIEKAAQGQTAPDVARIQALVADETIAVGNAFYTIPAEDRWTLVATGMALLDPNSPLVGAADREILRQLNINPAEIQELVFGTEPLPNKGAFEVLATKFMEITARTAAENQASAQKVQAEATLALAHAFANAAKEYGATVLQIQKQQTDGQIAAAQDVAAWLADTAQEITTTMGLLANSTANAATDFTRKITDTIADLGEFVDRVAQSETVKSFTSGLKTLAESTLALLTGSTSAYGKDEITKSFQKAEETVTNAAQTPVLTPGGEASPFTADMVGYDPNQVASEEVSEGHAKSFTLYLPYEAGESGQSVKLTLGGASADKFSLLYQGQKIDLGSDGAFEVKVRAGTTQASFLLWELGDVDQDETLQIKAQLVDGNGQATHLEHVELNLALDAVDEIPPQFDRTIVGDLETIDTQPDAEGIQAGYDSLGNELVDADKPSPGKEDALFDSASNDLIQPGSGNDVVYALNGGNDLIEGGAGSDIVNGGAGDDRLYGGDEIDIAAAIERGDSAVGTGQRGDWLSGGLGDDTVVGGDGDDVLFGGGGSDLLIGGAGNDVLDGGDNYTATSFDWSVQTIQGNPFDRIFTPVSPVRTDSLSSDVGGDDVLIGGTGNDVLMGLQGNDYLDGGADDDVLAGNDGDDILLGGSGDDLMTGDYGKLAYDSGAGLVVQGNDYLDGGDGDDWIQGEGGQDELFGGTGNDLLLGDAEYLDGALHGEDYLDGEEGDDTLVGGGGNDELHGGDGNDSLEGDQSTLAGEYHGNDYLDGGDGDDTLNGQGGDDQLFGGAGNDLLKGDSLEAPAGADYLDGEEGNDTLIGGGGADTLFGGDGDDQLAGDSDDTPQSDHGNDYLDGGAGNDTLAGGAGDDTLIGGSGNDDLLGGEGNDIYRVNLGDGEDYLNDYDGANAMEFGSGISLDSLRLGVSGGIPVLQYGETDRIAINGAVTEYRFADGSVVDGKDMMALLTDPVNLAGSAGANLLLGGGGDDALWGEAGDDTLISGQGSDYLHGGDGRDVLAGGAGNDVLFGQEGDDDIQGGDGADQLVGGGGNDLLQGGAGADKLWGQAGDDTIEGGDGDDELIGGDGSDAMTGGRGDDWLWSGGTGAKTYVFNPGDGNDLVLSAAGDRHIRFGKPVFNRSQREPTTGGARLRIHRRAARLRGACCMF
jgi:Ca2+-binding RTX toxin-like protein